MAVNGGDDEEGFEPSTMDYVMHYMTLPFKLAFATVPPTEYGGGWVCFGVALAYIGLVTALIGDLAGPSSFQFSPAGDSEDDLAAPTRNTSL